LRRRNTLLPAGESPVGRRRVHSYSPDTKRREAQRWQKEQEFPDEWLGTRGYEVIQSSDRARAIDLRLCLCDRWGTPCDRRGEASWTGRDQIDNRRADSFSFVLMLGFLVAAFSL